MRLSSIKQQKISYGLNFKRAEDFAFWVDCFLVHRISGFVIPEVLLNYRTFVRPTTPIWHRKVIQDKVNPALGINCSAEELDIHTGIVVENRAKLIGKYGLDGIFNWLEKLNNHCHQQNFFFSPIVTSLLHAYAERIIAAAPNPLQALRIYHKYTLSNNHDFLYMYLRTAARWGYRLFSH